MYCEGDEHLKNVEMYHDVLLLRYGNSLPEDLRSKILEDGSVVFIKGNPNIKRFAKTVLALSS